MAPSPTLLTVTRDCCDACSAWAWLLVPPTPLVIHARTATRDCSDDSPAGRLRASSLAGAGAVYPRVSRCGRACLAPAREAFRKKAGVRWLCPEPWVARRRPAPLFALSEHD